MSTNPNEAPPSAKAAPKAVEGGNEFSKKFEAVMNMNRESIVGWAAVAVKKLDNGEYDERMHKGLDIFYGPEAAQLIMDMAIKDVEYRSVVIEALAVTMADIVIPAIVPGSDVVTDFVANLGITNALRETGITKKPEPWYTWDGLKERGGKLVDQGLSALASTIMVDPVSGSSLGGLNNPAMWRMLRYMNGKKKDFALIIAKTTEYHAKKIIPKKKKDSNLTPQGI